MLEETKLINLKKTLMEFATLVESMVDQSITGLKVKKPDLLHDVIQLDEPRANTYEIELDECYPVLLPYGVAVAPKGAGFYGAGTNLAHNLPLGSNPHTDKVAAENFNISARRLWVPPADLMESITRLQHHRTSGRPLERDHALARRDVSLRELPPAVFRPVSDNRLDQSAWTRSSPMHAVDAVFLATVKANPHLRPRVGNPDEMRSNRMLQTLDALKFLVTHPERGIPEDVHGAVITALNEEAVAAAALANKGGINIIVTYEAFGAKMHGVVRQEITFAKHCKEAGQSPRWLSVPLVLTSHTWENAKNEQSHQDPVMAEAMLGEPSDVSRVMFIPDYNSAVAAMRGVYQTQGQVWTLVIPKYDSVPELFSPDEATRLLQEGAIRLWHGAGYDVARQQVILTAVGAYQLEQVVRASARLKDRGVPHSVVYMLEPGRFRFPRSEGESVHAASADARAALYPNSAPARIFVTHTRPEIILGMLQPLNTGAGRTVGLGFTGQGGTLTTLGMLFVNRCTWAHILPEVAGLLSLPLDRLAGLARTGRLRRQVVSGGHCHLALSS